MLSFTIIKHKSMVRTGDLVKIDGGWMANAGKANIAKLSERT